MASRVYVFVFSLILIVLMQLNLAGDGHADAMPINNHAVINISLNAGEERDYVLAVPAGAASLSVVLHAMTGDLDLYTRYGQQATGDTYACRPYLGDGEDETCVHNQPAGGNWFITVYAYSSGAATLQVDYTTSSGGGSNVQILANGASLALNLSAGQERDFRIDVPAGASSLQVDLTDMNGDLDLYTRYGDQPTDWNYACRPYLGDGQSESCFRDTPNAGAWYITVYGYTAGRATLKVNYTAGSGAAACVTLNNGQNVSLSLQSGQQRDFRIDVPAGASDLRIALTGMNGDLDLYTRHGQRPTDSLYDCRPYFEAGADETCVKFNPQAGFWYITVYAYASGSAQLRAIYATPSGQGHDSGGLPPAGRVWSSWYWPWRDNINPNLYDNGEALNRYDAVDSGANAQQWEYDNHGPNQNPTSWWGSCHAWAGAACWVPQPENQRYVDNQRFRVRDLKGLITASYYLCGFASNHELQLDRPSPGAFWKILQDEIKGQDPMHGRQLAVIGELYFGDEIWNYPIDRYEVSYSDDTTVSGAITIWFAQDTDPAYADRTDLVLDSLTYEFEDVQLIAQRPSDSGQWIVPADPQQRPYHRPDAVWRPFAAADWTRYAANIHLKKVILNRILP